MLRPFRCILFFALAVEVKQTDHILVLNALLIYFTSDNGFGMCCNLLFFFNLLLGASCHYYISY